MCPENPAEKLASPYRGFFHSMQRNGASAGFETFLCHASLRTLLFCHAGFLDPQRTPPYLRHTFMSQDGDLSLKMSLESIPVRIGVLHLCLVPTF
jgi:hypothetical protein